MKFLSVLALGVLMSNALAGEVNAKKISTGKLALNATGAVLISGGFVVSAGSIALAKINYDGMSPVLLYVIFGAPLASTMSISGAASGGLEFFESAANLLSNRANKQEIINNYKLLVRESKLFSSEQNYMGSILSDVLSQMKIDGNAGLATKNQVFGELRKAAKDLAKIKKENVLEQFDQEVILAYFIDRGISADLVNANAELVLSLSLLEEAMINGSSL